MAPKVLRVLQLIDCMHGGTQQTRALSMQSGCNQHAIIAHHIDCMHGVANREEDPAGLIATLVCELGEEARAHERPDEGGHQCRRHRSSVTLKVNQGQSEEISVPRPSVAIRGQLGH